MKAAKLIALAASLTVSAAVFAELPPSTQTSPTGGKTREQVRAELVDAQHHGVIPAKKTDYPPSADTVKQNQRTHAIAKHGGQIVKEPTAQELNATK
ncbi:DUF4148 domain-containing protein [Burkholderia alba]|uniref:DUF4148 domain-containing protein n=1 Tax=Burkholderia alba TaxID=2683677 RepID=UPI002B05ED77|nr:DUF4148 domain-containing protein [Burkholderia alba]